MPYTIDWYVEQRVIRITVNGNLDLDDFEQLHEESFDYVKQSEHTVHAIADLTNFETIPTNIRALFSASSHEKTHKQGMTVLVMPNLNMAIRFSVGLVLQTLRLEYRLAETIDEAIEILQRVDTELVTVVAE